MPGREKVKTALWLHIDHWKVLKKMAATMDRSTAQLVREAIEDLIQKYKSTKS
jgi:predicted DNA-binding protein